MPHAASCRERSRTQFSAAFCRRGARHCGTAPLRGVVHFKPSQLQGRIRKFYLFRLDENFRASSFVADEKADDSAHYEAVPLNSATIRSSSAYSNPRAAYRHAKKPPDSPRHATNFVFGLKITIYL